MTQMVDILLTNAIVLTMDEKLTQYEPGAVAVQGDHILAVGLETDLVNAYDAKERFDCGQKVLMPGLICSCACSHDHIARLG
jgi:predicted amidohydrolase YtcJ